MGTNRLINEKSPYLLQHAYNPVDWYPWGADAFREARDCQKPIFLSIGYSTCHWCHVMEKESFENQEIADLLNRSFIAVKVDREERPDVDAVYMSVCQAMNGSGGWPLTILMTPEQKPFWAGTYLPPKSRYGQPGLKELLREVTKRWQTGREQLLEAGDKIAAYIAKTEKAAPGTAPDKSLLHLALHLFQHSFDHENGGFGNAPKFPTPHNLLFLMEYARRERSQAAQAMAETTLIQMSRGGLFDHIGGGFSRYSTDKEWLAPHFEKMLYDNALLAYTYLEAFSRTKIPYYKSVAERTLDYVLRELTGPAGEFYCGQDADSDGQEGRYYLFAPDEISGVLGGEAGARFCSWFNMTREGNFEGKNIPNLLKNQAYQNPYETLDEACKQLYQYRLARSRLHKDDKVLTSWNALMIAALSKAYRVLGDKNYLNAAKKAYAFIRVNLTAPDGRLWIRWREGHAAHSGQLDDYAFLCWALLELYAADWDACCLVDAAGLAGFMESLFLDTTNGGFFLTASDSEQLIARPKELYDGAMPSGNSAAALALVKLAKLTGDPRWQAASERQLAFLSGNIRDYPAGHTFTLLAFLEALYPSCELICASSERPPEGLRMLSETHHFYTMLKTPENTELLAKIAPYTVSYPIPASGTMYYLCRNGACSAPVDSLQKLEKLL